MSYQSRLQNEETDRLFQAVLSLRDQEECYRFFEDICTIHEIQSLAQRLTVARMLKDQCTYHEIVAKTTASTATISRVKRALDYGADGYRRILDRLEKQEGPDA